jgi:hypothetical protein
MKSFAKLLAVAPLVLGATLSANAATLDITGTADNQFTVYLATAAEFGANLLGTQIGNNPAGANWQQSFTLPSTPLSGTPLYLQVVLTNWTPTNGFPQYPYSPTSNPSAFLADLSISGGGYAFPNLSASVSTNSVDWLGSTTGNPATWVTTVSGVVSYGTNGIPGSIWYNANGGPILGITSGAQWIFYGDQSTALYSDLSIEIQSTSSSSLGTPLPAALPLFASGLGAFGLLGWRRKRKKAAAIAAA